MSNINVLTIAGIEIDGNPIVSSSEPKIKTELTKLMGMLRKEKHISKEDIVLYNSLKKYPLKDIVYEIENMIEDVVITYTKNVSII